jgi:hypothetical protein
MESCIALEAGPFSTDLSVNGTRHTYPVLESIGSTARKHASMFLLTSPHPPNHRE